MIQAASGFPEWSGSAFRIQRLGEDDIEGVIVRAGGRRAHPDADRRKAKGADFILGSTVIELKILEGEGLDEPKRQQKMAELFRPRFPTRPTIVLDRSMLDAQGQRDYDRLMEGPVKTAVSSARQQLKQSRTELGLTGTVLWIINNGYSSLDHDALKELVAKRAKNDSKEIDAVIVSGAYFYSDSFDSYFLWPMDCVQIHSERPFQEFESLRNAWNDLATDRMTRLVTEPPAANNDKGAAEDVTFQVDDVTYVVPTPPIGGQSSFFIAGRPRKNSTGIETSPPVATVFAGLSRSEWAEFRRCNPDEVPYADYSDWKKLQARARDDCDLEPLIAMPVTHSGWCDWARRQPKGTDVSVHRYATDLFHEKMDQVISAARERKEGSVLPPRHLMLVVEEIGQDLALDVAHLAEISIRPDGTDHVEEVWVDQSMFFRQALVVAAAEAIARGVEFVLWRKDRTYAWC